jgi:transposase-like protein
MNRLSVDVTCPRCGGDVDFVTNGRPVGNEARAVIHCPPCRHDYVVCVMLVSEG